MVGTVGTGRTHYEVLGLEPTASDDEIERAFAGAISIFQPHGFGGVAEAAVAFRTLRDPARRRAYDASLKPKPDAPQPLMTWRVGAQFMRASGMPVLPRPSEALAEPSVESEPTTPSIAAALRKLASPEPLDLTPPTPAPPPGPVADRSDPPAGDRVVHLALNEGRQEVAAGPAPWKVIGMVAGGVVVAGAVIGGWAGWDASSATELRPGTSAAQAVLPPPTTFTVADPATTIPNPIADNVRRPPANHGVRAAPRPVRPPPRSRLADLDRQLSGPATPEPDGASATTPVASAAALPLPTPVIARTLARIGYPCGQVASSVPGGSAGVFKVTCSSGHSYQATPVRGRYHFRRVAGG